MSENTRKIQQKTHAKFFLPFAAFFFSNILFIKHFITQTKRFPCNQFGSQERKGEAEIKEFVTSKFGVEFPMFSKINVNGNEEDPVYTFLKSHLPGKTVFLPSNSLDESFLKI